MGVSADADLVLAAVYDAQLRQESLDGGSSGRPASINTKALAEHISLTPLRMNNAVEVLENGGLIDCDRQLSTRPYATHGLMLTARGRLLIEQAHTEKGTMPTKQHERTSAVRIFVSHSAADAALAEDLIEFLEAGLVVPDGSIRCTSVEGYALEGGDDAPEVLRANLNDCDVVLAVLSRRSLESSFVLMELGAAWVLRKRAIPLLTAGVSFEQLPKPFRDIHALRLASESEMVGLISTISTAAGLEKANNDPKRQKMLRRLIDRANTPQQSIKPPSEDQEKQALLTNDGDIVMALRGFLEGLKKTFDRKPIQFATIDATAKVTPGSARRLLVAATEGTRWTVTNTSESFVELHLDRSIGMLVT